MSLREFAIIYVVEFIICYVTEAGKNYKCNILNYKIYKYMVTSCMYLLLIFVENKRNYAKTLAMFIMDRVMT